MKIKIYRIEILPVVLCVSETWSLTLSEERRLRVFKNRVLKRIFGPKGDGVTGEWRKLRNEKHDDLYCSPYIVWWRGEAYTGFWWGNLRLRVHLRDPGIDGSVM